MVEEKGVPADRVSVIYPGIDLAEYERPGHRQPRFPGSVPTHKVVMYVGSIVHPNQGVPILIECVCPRSSRRVPTPGACWSAAPPRPASATEPSSDPTATG